ncbi:MAG: OmpH family outer membrane protein [Phycisphaerales bacterium]|nr:OmpH family outer membrane protein [Phycisphaerales bacterium]
MSRKSVMMMVTTSMIALMAVAWSATALQGTRRANPTAVAVVNVERLMNSLDEMKDRTATWQKNAEARQKLIDEIVDQKTRLEDQLKTVPNDDASLARRREISTQILEADTLAKARTEVFQRLIEVERGEFFSIVYAKSIDAIGRLAKQDGWDVVLFDDRGVIVPKSAPATTVTQVIQSKTILYASDTVDITDDLITMMNLGYRKP